MFKYVNINLRYSLSQEELAILILCYSFLPFLSIITSVFLLLQPRYPLTATTFQILFTSFLHGFLAALVERFSFPFQYSLTLEVRGPTPGGGNGRVQSAKS